MAHASDSRPVRWQTLLILLLTVGLVWWFLQSINLAEAWQATLSAHWGWIAAAVLVTLQTYVVRAWRWRLLLAPIGPASFRVAFRTTVMGFAASSLLPARAGEVLRPYLLSRHEGINAASAFATIIIERLLDLVTVLFLFGTAILFSGVEVGAVVKQAGSVVAAVALLGVVVLFVLAGHPERLVAITDRIAPRLPAVLARVVGHLVRTLTDGLRVMRSPSHLALAIVWSLPLWLSIALGVVFTSWAFDLRLSLMGSFIVLGYLTVGVAAPTPGAAGGFHAAYLLAMTQISGAGQSEAGAAAIVLHLVSFGPVTLLGLIFMWQDGLTLGNVKAVQHRARPVES